MQLAQFYKKYGQNLQLVIKKIYYFVALKNYKSK